jgi:hypothetical protein
MTTATETKHLASVCWHITIDIASGEVISRDIYEEWTLDTYHATCAVHMSNLRIYGALHLADSHKPLQPVTLSETIHDNDPDLSWMQRDDGSIMGNNVNFQRAGCEHLIGIAYL